MTSICTSCKHKDVCDRDRRIIGYPNFRVTECKEYERKGGDNGMTREEAIQVLEEEAEYLYQDDRPYNREAFDMAIEALSEPSGDLISRADVHKTLSLLATEGGADTKMLLMDAHEFIDALPSADRPIRLYEEGAIELLRMTGWLTEHDKEIGRPQGEWIDVDNEPYCECSVCGSYIDNLDDDYAFCPRCGARMETT